MHKVSGDALITTGNEGKIIHDTVKYMVYNDIGHPSYTQTPNGKGKQGHGITKPN